MLTEHYILALLNLPGVGPRTIEGLLDGGMTPRNVSELSDFLQLKNVRFDHSTLEEAWEKATSVLAQIEPIGVECLGFWNEKFPAYLREIPKPPVILFALGDSNILNLPSIAIIGTRAPTDFGYRAGRRIASTMAENGIVVVSGLAEGCDSAAHLGCVDHHAPTVAVLAHGHGKIYPKANTDLANDILKCGGCLLSEYPPGTPAMRGNFVSRDRLQSGLSRGIIVIETDIKGGTMHTVRFALEQKRFVAAIDHPRRHRTHEKTRGNQDMISRGEAIPLKNSADIDRLLLRFFPKDRICSFPISSTPPDELDLSP